MQALYELRGCMAERAIDHADDQDTHFDQPAVARATLVAAPRRSVAEIT